MKAFKEWWKEFKPQINSDTYNGNEDEIRKAIARCTWREALKMLQNEIKFGQSVAYSDTDVLIAIKKIIREELKDEIEKTKCRLCGGTGKPCDACGEYHRSNCMCPPHEVRMKWAKNICPECGIKEETINFYNHKPESEFLEYKKKYPHVSEKQLRKEWEDSSGDLRHLRLSVETNQWP